MAMASLHDGSSFQIGKPHFFKIIFHNTVREGRLRLPMKFVSKYGNELSNPVLLKVPNGDLWSVEFGKSSDGEIWLQTGWREFMEHYSLTHGSFLVFEYQTKCQFHVFVFDKSASEIAYPFCKNNAEEDNLQEANMDDTVDDKSVQILDSPPRKSKEESPLKCCRPNKMSRNNAGKAKYRKSLLKPDSKEKRVPRFIVNLMKRKQKKDIIMLQVGSGSWPVKLLSGSGRLSGGWRAFMRDNFLRVGDVCAFEMIKEDVLLVSIFRNGS